MWPEVTRAKTENRHELVLGGNEISERLAKTGLDYNIFSLNGLNYLDIHETSLEAIPDDISKLAQLQSLVLHSNKLQVFNPNITKLDKLKLLDLSRNQVKEIPEEINQLTNIVTLNFSFNNLESFPKLLQTCKLAVLNLSNNKLTTFPEICSEQLTNLSEVKLSDNKIEIIPPEIRNISGLKVFEIGNNKVKVVPGELASCTKLKIVDLKNNPISDRRLLKLIDQCRTKQIIDYVRAHCPKTIVESSKTLKDKTKKAKSDSDEEFHFKYVIKVHPVKDNPRIIVNEYVKSVREHIIACVIDKVAFTNESFKKFIQIQNKLHDTICAKRNAATIATHDFTTMPAGDLEYTTLPPNELQIHPLNRTISMTGADLFTKLQTEANNLRKEKKRSTYSGIHKYLYLIEGHPRYPCLLNSQGVVISFPPLTNSEASKIHVGTTSMLVEVTSSTSLHSCKMAMEALLKELVHLVEQDLEVTPIKNVDQQGIMKLIYPSRTDLCFDGGEIKVTRD